MIAPPDVLAGLLALIRQAAREGAAEALAADEAAAPSTPTPRLTLDDLAAAEKSSRATIRRLTREGALPRLPIGGLANASKGAGIVTARDDSSALPPVPAEILSDSGGRSRDRTCDFVRVKQANEGAMSAIATACDPRADQTCTTQFACFPVLPDDSSRNVTAPGANGNDPPTPIVGPSPTTSDDAIKLAIKLAVDAGEYERAAALLDVAKRTAKPASLTPIDSVRGRDRER